MYCTQLFISIFKSYVLASQSYGSWLGRSHHADLRPAHTQTSTHGNSLLYLKDGEEFHHRTVHTPVSTHSLHTSRLAAMYTLCLQVHTPRSSRPPPAPGVSPTDPLPSRPYPTPGRRPQADTHTRSRTLHTSETHLSCHVS